MYKIALQTIEEENKENLSIVFIVADKLLDEFFNQEWVEELAEIELVDLKMEKAWKDLPGHIQKEIYFHQRGRINEKINEMVYFGILNDFVGKIWLENFLNNELKILKGEEQANDEDIFVLKDPNVVVDDNKKTVYRNIRKKFID